MDKDTSKAAGGEEEYRPADYDSSVFDATQPAAPALLPI